MKKLEIEKTKPTFILSTFKTDITIVGLDFLISNIFINKFAQRRKLFVEKKYLLGAIWLYENAIPSKLNIS